MSADHSIRLDMGIKDWIFLIVLAFVWGASFVFFEIALNDLQVMSIVLMRVGIAALALHVFMRVRGQSLFFPWPVWKSFIFVALVGQVIPFSIIVWTQIYITASLSSILNATLPFFTVLVAHLFTEDEKLKSNKIYGILVGFAGVIIIIGPSALDGFSKDILAQIIALGAALCYAITLIYARRFRKMKVPAVAVATGQLTCSTLILIPLVLFFDQPWLGVWPAPETWAALAGLGLLSTALAFIIYFHLVSAVGGTNTSLVTFLIPVSTICLAAAFLEEGLALYQLLGMVVIACGLLLIDGRFLNRFSLW